MKRVQALSNVDGIWGDAGLNYRTSTRGAGYGRETRDHRSWSRARRFSVDGSEAAVIGFAAAFPYNGFSGTILTGLCGAALIRRRRFLRRSTANDVCQGCRKRVEGALARRVRRQTTGNCQPAQRAIVCRRPGDSTASARNVVAGFRTSPGSATVTFMRGAGRFIRISGNLSDDDPAILSAKNSAVQTPSGC